MKHSMAWLAVMALGCALLSSGSADARGAVARPQASDDAPKKDKGKSKKLTDAQIRRILIEESIAAYTGNCPCPYSRASNSSRCGRRSAHSRAGGEAPLCFDADVSKEMVQAYRDERAEE